MSGEGELYLKMTFLQDGKDPNGLRKQKKAFKILDEAKQEIMPKTVHMIADNPEYNFGHGEDHPRLICVRQDELFQMLNGLKKWFGEVNTQK